MWGWGFPGVQEIPIPTLIVVEGGVLALDDFDVSFPTTSEIVLLGLGETNVILHLRSSRVFQKARMERFRVLMRIENLYNAP